MPKEIYQILQNIMDERGLSIAETARVCDLPDSTVRGIINRKQKSIALEVAFKLSRGLAVSLETLNGEDQLEQNNKTSSHGNPQDEAKVLKIAQQLQALVIDWGWTTEGVPLSPEQTDMLKAMVLMIKSGRRKRPQD